MVNKDNKTLVPGSIVLAAVLIAGAIIYTSGSHTAPAPANTGGTTPPAATIAPTIDDDAVLGDPKAPVTLIEFGDYECPYCEQMYTTVEKQLRDEYIKTGKVKMVFRDFPLSFHPAAQPAAEAAQCAGAQGKYWAYHDALYEHQSTIETLDYLALAGQLGLDKAAFKTCTANHTFKAEIAKDFADGTAAGVNGTPTSFVNGVAIEGAVPYATFKAAIDAALAKAK